MDPNVDEFLENAVQWQKEMKQLRQILLDCGLEETIKWSKPCYAYNNKNVAVIQGFKDYCALLFFDGYLLSDTEGILVKTGEHTRVGRQARFTDVKEIKKVAHVLKAYVFEAIELETSGIKADIAKPKENLVITDELKTRFNENPLLESAFLNLSPGKQKAYIMHFKQPKQVATKYARIDKWTSHILNGKGMHDDYLARKKK